VRPALAMADAFVLCSRLDPFPSVVIEAFLAGLPVVGFDRWQGSRELIASSGFGEIVPYRDHSETIAALDRLLAGSAVTESARERGPDHVREHFSYSRYVERLVEVLGRVERASSPIGG